MNFFPVFAARKVFSHSHPKQYELCMMGIPMLRYRTMLFSQPSLSTGYVPGYNIGRIHCIWKWIERQLDKEKPR